MKVTVEQVINLLDDVSARGFLSPEVPYSWSGRHGSAPVFHQTVNFTEDEKQIVRQFMSENIAILRSVDYPTGDMFDCKQNRRTISLLGMISHMIHDKDCGPEYVADNAKRLQDIQERFNTISVNDLKSLYGE